MPLAWHMLLERTATELTPRCQHPLQHGRGVIFPFPYEALLMRLEVRDTPTDLLALGPTQSIGFSPTRSTISLGNGRSSLMPFAKTIVSLTSASRSAFQSAMAHLPHQSIGPTMPLSYGPVDNREAGASVWVGGTMT